MMPSIITQGPAMMGVVVGAINNSKNEAAFARHLHFFQNNF